MPAAAMIAVLLLFVAASGSAPAASRRRIISMSAVAAASKNGVAPIDVGVTARESWRTLRHPRIRIGALRQQRLHELQLWPAARGIPLIASVKPNTGLASPLSQVPAAQWSGVNAGIADIRIRAPLQQKQRERHLRSHRRDEQRRAARRNASPRSSGLLPLDRRPPLCRQSRAIGPRPDVHVDARGQQQPRAFQIAFTRGEMQRGKSFFRARRERRAPCSMRICTTSGWRSAAAHINAV